MRFRRVMNDTQGVIESLVYSGALSSCSSDDTESACNAVDQGSVPRSGRSPGVWKGQTHPVFCLKL